MKMYCKIKRPDNAKEQIEKGTEIIIQEKIDGIKDAITEFFSKHFDQVDQIEQLKARNQELEYAAVLTTSFANQLNRILEDKNSTRYLPQVSLVRVISYVKLNDYKRLCLLLFFDSWL